jgi:type III secretion system FlhB-like substrate exporter
MIALHKKIKEQQERMDTQVVDPDELLDMSLDHTVALKEMEKMQKNLREIMVYQSPPELGSLYTDVVEMFGLVQEKQEATHLLHIRRKKEAWRRQDLLLDKLRRRVAWVVVLTIIVMEIWGLILALLLARPHS